MDKIDPDIKIMSIMELEAEIMRLRTGIRNHRDQKGDDNCWLDDFALYGLLPEKVKANPELPDKELMMVNCSRYYDCRKSGQLYVPLTEMPESKEPFNPDGYKCFGRAFTQLTNEELEEMIKNETHQKNK